MRVELFAPDSDTDPRHRVRHDQAFAMMLRPGSIEWGSKRTALEKFNYAAGDLALCDRHQGEWVGLMNVTHLQLGISDAALMACSDGAYGEVELRPSRKFADPRLSAMVAAVHAEMAASFPSGRLFLDSVEQAMAVALVNGHAVRHRPVQISRGGLGPARLRRIVEVQPGPEFVTHRSLHPPQHSVLRQQCRLSCAVAHSNSRLRSLKSNPKLGRKSLEFYRAA